MTNRLNFVLSDFKRLDVDIEKLSEIFMAEKIAITGANGFLGMWLICLVEYINRTKEKDIQLFLIDKSCSQFEKISTNLTTRYEFIKCKIESLTFIPLDVDFFIHAAGNPDARDYLEDPLGAFSTDTCGALNLVNLLKDSEKLKSFIFTSTGWLSSKENLQPNLNEGLKRYVESKECAERIIFAASDQIKLPVTIVRLYSYFGPFQKLSSPWVVNEFVRSALVSKGLKLYSSGESKRALMYGADLAVSVAKALCVCKKSNVLEVGAVDSLTILDLATKIASIFDISTTKIERSMISKYNESDFVPSLELKEMSLAKNTDIDSALTRTIKWYQEFENNES